MKRIRETFVGTKVLSLDLYISIGVDPSDNGDYNPEQMMLLMELLQEPKYGLTKAEAMEIVHTFYLTMEK